MQREHIQSSMIDSVGYDPASKTLEVEFTSGPIWEYWAVSPDMYNALMSAPSAGKYFLQNIRGKFQERQVG